jgi:hypothetical protein
VAVYPALFPRPVYTAPGTRPIRSGAVRMRRARRIEGRPAKQRRAGAVAHPTMGITPLAAVLGFAILAATSLLALVRVVAVVPSVDGSTRARRRHASRARLARTGQRIGLAIACIVVVFCVGLIYVDRAVQISARGYDLAALQAERDDLLREQRTLQNDLARLGSEAAVGHEALDQGLIRLGPPILLPAS